MTVRDQHIVAAEAKIPIGIFRFITKAIEEQDQSERQTSAGADDQPSQREQLQVRDRGAHFSVTGWAG